MEGSSKSGCRTEVGELRMSGCQTVEGRLKGLVVGLYYQAKRGMLERSGCQTTGKGLEPGCQAHTL